MLVTTISAPAILDALECDRPGCPCHVSTRRGHGLTHCPAHNDPGPSLNVSERDGTILVRCHAGCSQRDVIAALQDRDLWPKPERRDPVPSPNGQQTTEPRRIVATYDYHDEQGQLLHQTIRYLPKGFSQRRPDGQGGWIWSLNGIEPVLYHLPELLAADPERWVLLCEGEKDADRLGALGFIATTNAMGAKKWRDSYTEPLRGRKVSMLPDNDEPGADHVRKAAAALLDVAAQLKVVELPDRPENGGDVSDWLDSGGTAGELRRLIETSPTWTPTADDEPGTEEPMPAPVKIWPAPPNQVALYGLAGDIVRALDRATEADQIGVLVSLLAAVGNIIDAGPHWSVSGSNHSLRLFPVLVGPTSKGRKGTAWSALRLVLKLAAPDWYEHHIVSGLSSGEGLIWSVRDKISKTEPIKDHGHVTGYQEVETDPGVTDKRLFVIEEEFASVLKLMGREGNILSATVRQAWDSGDLRTLTKNSPARATGAHISILGHITKDELLRYLDNSEAANGFANRFLWVCVKRSKELPDGGEVDEVTLEDLAGRLREVLEVAAKIDLMQRDDEASAGWRTVYGPLSAGGYGLMGAVTSRAEAQVMRLAALYAILDKSHVIRLPHLRAALALWDYIEASAEYIFGDALGDPIADTILAALRQGGEMTRTEIIDLFGRHARRNRIDTALNALLEAKKVRRELDKTTGGRPREVWHAN